MFNINEEYKVLSLLHAEDKTASGNSTGVAVEGYEEDMIVILDVGTVSGTLPTLDVVVKTSDASGGTYTTVATFGQVTAASKVGAVSLSVEGLNSASDEQKYVRVDYTIGGTTPHFNMSVVALAKVKIAQASLNASTPA